MVKLPGPLDESRRKIVTARLMLSNAVLYDAPVYVIQALKKWNQEIEPHAKAEDSLTATKQGVGVADSCAVGLVDVPEGGGKSDA